MPLDRVPGQTLDALIDHEDGLRKYSCVRGPPQIAFLGWARLRQGPTKDRR